jgi:hypothetical protein
MTTETLTPAPNSKIIDENGTPTTLAGALALFQSKLPEIPKARTGQDGNRTFKYADITDITRACAPLLADLGLSITAATQVREGRTILVMKLMHVSDEVETAELDVTAPAGNMKTMGSNITYARRYLYGALTGIVTDEDTDAAGTQVTAPVKQATNPATGDQLERIQTHASEYLARRLNFAGIMAGVLGRPATRDDMTQPEAAKLLAHLDSLPPEAHHQ